MKTKILVIIGAILISFTLWYIQQTNKHLSDVIQKCSGTILTIDECHNLFKK